MVEKFLLLISDTNLQIQESQWTPSRINPKKRAGVGLLDSYVQLFVASWTAAHQAPLSITSSRSLLKLMSIKSVMPSKPTTKYLKPTAFWLS